MVHIERIVATPKNLNKVFRDFPDIKQRYDFALPYCRGKVVADIACGNGCGTYVVSSVAQVVDGYDIAASAVAHAKKYFKKPNNAFYQVQKLARKKYDVVISFETIEHMDEKDGDVFLKNLRRALKPKGTLIISTPINRGSQKWHVTPYHIREYSPEEFPKKLQKNGFRILAMYGQGSQYHQKLYTGTVPGTKISIFGLMKSGIHKLFPQALRDLLKKIILGNPAQGLQITQEAWMDKAIQIAVCKSKE